LLTPDEHALIAKIFEPSLVFSEPSPLLVQLFDFFVKGPALVLRRLSKRLTMGRLPEGENKARLSISFSAESEAARVSSLG
jgi:hypothetical protein